MPNVPLKIFFKNNLVIIIFTHLLILVLTGCASSQVETITQKQFNPLYNSSFNEVENMLNTKGDLVYTFIYGNSQYTGYYFHESSTPGDFMLFKDNYLISIHTYDDFRKSWEISPAHLKSTAAKAIVLPYERGFHHVVTKLIINDLTKQGMYSEKQDIVTSDNPLEEDGLSWNMIVSIGIPSGLITSPDMINAYINGAHIVRKWASIPLDISRSTAFLHMGYPDYKAVSRDHNYEIWEYRTIMTTLYIGFRYGRLEWKFNDNEKVHAYFNHIKMIYRPRFRNKPST